MLKKNLHPSLYLLSIYLCIYYLSIYVSTIYLRYENWRGKEVIQRLKDKHGDNMEEVLEDDDESSGEEEDSDAEGTVIYLSIYLSITLMWS